jgi:opacity protein-like surface antigen
MSRMKIPCGWLAQLMLVGMLAAMAHGQTVHSARDGSASLWAGGEYANFKAGFPNGSNTRLAGIGAFADYNINHSIGIEGHARFFNLHRWNGETQQDYLAGPRYTFLHSDKWRPFASFQIGVVKIHYPFSMGTGTSFAMVPGGGLEYRLNRKWSVRAGYEFQMLANSPDFTNVNKFGIKPNGGMAGISYRIF